MLAIATIGVLTACGDDETGSGGGGGSAPTCADYADVSGSPSLADDIIPIFALSCALSSSCHQLPASSAQEGLALGRPMAMLPLTQQDLDEVHALLINSSALRSQLPLVQPGEPAQSWLMAKLEYADPSDPDPKTLFSECPDNTQCGDNCGQRMPQNGGRLDQARIDTIAAWIKDGAQNN